MEYILDDLDATRAWARDFAKSLHTPQTVALHGDLGMGKSEIAREIIKTLRGKDTVVPSPTFTLVQSYDGVSHFDLYRIGDVSELEEIGLKYAIDNDITLIEWPDTIRVVSDVLESNGSSSMATTCAGTLALMDAGVPIKNPVAGIAMGLIKNPGEDKYAILSDILGDEDHLGDMDFKTTGTKNGLTATQMDIKCDGLSYEILERALMQAKAGREHIMGEMMKTISEPRPELKPHVPRIEQIIIPKEFIGAVIGPGGKVIQQMQEDTQTVITIDEEDGVGKVQISAPDRAAIEAAMAKIKAIVAIPEVGQVYHGTVRSVMPYGCFVEFLPGKDGLLHISEIDWKRLDTVEEAGIKEDDEIDVKLIDIDQKTGKYKLSRRVLIEKPADYQERPQRERRPRPERGERGDRRQRPERNDRPRHNEPRNEAPAQEGGDFKSALDDLLK